MGERVFGHRANGGTGSGFISSPALGSEAPAGAQAHSVSMRKQQAAQVSEPQNLSLLPASELTAQRSVATGSGLCCPEQARDCTAECGNRKQLVLPRAGTGLLVCGHAGGTARESGLDLGVLSPFFPALKPRAAARGFCSYSYLAKIVKCSLHMRLFVCVCFSADLVTRRVSPGLGLYLQHSLFMLQAVSPSTTSLTGGVWPGCQHRAQSRASWVRS